MIFKAKKAYHTHIKGKVTKEINFYLCFALSSPVGKINYGEEIIMISLILGHKGSGKTKHLIECVNEAVENSNGNVVCVEDKSKLTFDVSHRARLVAAADYKISGYDAFYGLLCGLCAGDHDITDVLVDATLKIGGRDYEKLAVFFEKVYNLSEELEKNFVFTVSADKEEIPESVFNFCKVL